MLVPERAVEPTLDEAAAPTNQTKHRNSNDRRSHMQAKDIMTRHVVSVAPDASILVALQLMLENQISGLPVVDHRGELLGIVTEGDFLRRAETGTERRRPRWLEFLLGPGMIASDYVQSHARRVEEVMTPNVWTVSEEAPLADIVALMEKRRIKRLPVMRGDELVGIVSRANLLRALAGVAGEIAPAPKTDEAIRRVGSATLGAGGHDRRDRPKWSGRAVGDGAGRTPAGRCTRRS
jgi:CBS domain-containing protein